VTTQTRTARQDARAEALATGAVIALVALVLAVVLAEIAVFPIANGLGEQYPEFVHLEAPLLTLSILLGLCVQTALLVTAVLVGFLHVDRILDPAALRLVDVLIGAIAAATAVVATSVPFIPGPPALGLLVLAGVVLGVALLLIVLLLRTRLRRAATNVGERTLFEP
jgi:hypothetical protein